MSADILLLIYYFLNSSFNIIGVSDLGRVGFAMHYRLHLNQTSRRSSLTAGLLIVIPK